MDLVLLAKADWDSRSHVLLYILKRVGGTAGIHLGESDVCTLASNLMLSPLRTQYGGGSSRGSSVPASPTLRCALTMPQPQNLNLHS